jgi:phosphoribosylglycinamide formyltransferase-1
MLTNHRPLRVAVLCSRRAPGLAALIDRQAAGHDEFEIACVLSSEPACADAAPLRQHDVPMVTHPIADFYTSRGSSVYRDFLTRRSYDRATVDLLEPHDVDLVLLDGYLYLLTKPMLDRYRNRILNLHFSDLTIRRADHGPAYAGIRAVRDAIVDGQKETCATVHLVNDEPDGGPPLVRSWTYPVSPLVERARRWSALDMLKAYAFAHQEWMMREVSTPLLHAALDLITSRRIDLDALAARDPAAVIPWLIDEHERLTPPDAMRIHEVLRGYRRASA